MPSEIAILHAPTAVEPFVVLDKPPGVPSAPLVAGEDCAYTQAERVFPLLRQVCGRKPIEHGLVHRLDTATGGLLLIAAEQWWYEYLCGVQQQGSFLKDYTATCLYGASVPEGFPEPPWRFLPGSDGGISFPCCVESYFRPFGPHQAQVRPVPATGGQGALRRKVSSRRYVTELRSLEPAGCRGTHAAYTVTCRISAGYRHQVRCHLAWVGLPVAGDVLYNRDAGAGGGLSFAATALRFPLPGGGEFSLVRSPART